MTAPAIFRIGPFAQTTDRRIAAVDVSLEMCCDHPRDDVEFFPRIDACYDDAGQPVDVPAPLSRLAGIAWDLVESRTREDSRADRYRVTIRPAVGVYPADSQTRKATA